MSAGQRVDSNLRDRPIHHVSQKISRSRDEKKAYGVHGNASSQNRRLPLSLGLVMSTASLQEGLIGSSSTSDNANHTTSGVLDHLLGSGRKLDTSLAILRVVADNGNVVAGSTTKRTAVTSLLLDIGDNSSLRHGAKGKNVADSQSSILTGVDELAGVHSLVGNESLGDHLVLVWVAELDLSKGSTTAGVVNDLLHNTTGVTVSLSIVKGAELGGGLVQAGVGL